MANAVWSTEWMCVITQMTFIRAGFSANSNYIRSFLRSSHFRFVLRQRSSSSYWRPANSTSNCRLICACITSSKPLTTKLHCTHESNGWLKACSHWLSTVRVKVVAKHFIYIISLLSLYLSAPHLLPLIPFAVLPSSFVLQKLQLTKLVRFPTFFFFGYDFWFLTDQWSVTTTEVGHFSSCCFESGRS